MCEVEAILGPFSVDVVSEIQEILDAAREIQMKAPLTYRQREDLREAVQHLYQAQGLLRYHMTHPTIEEIQRQAKQAGVNE